MQRCGLCSMLAGLLRRAVCGASRRNSDDLFDAESSSGQHCELVIFSGKEDDVYKLLPNPSAIIYSEDRLLLNALKRCPEFSENVEKFLTMHRRRKTKLATRNLHLDVAILDDFHNGQAKCILFQSHHWNFNAFTLDNVTGGRSLPMLCLHLFHFYGLLEHFRLDAACVWKMFTLIEEGYHSSNPYHNSVHAADVTQAMHCFLQQKKIQEYIQPLEIMASLVSAVAHDMDHPGVNQPFLIATSNYLAALYQNSSVLENHHWRCAIGSVIESGVAEQMADNWPKLRDQISSLILATDITRQQEFLNKFKTFIEDSVLDLTKPEDRHFVLQIALKCADISNPCRPWDLSRKWSMKVCEEFFRQGDYERRLNLPITSMCDRHTTSIPKIQAGFLKFVVTPLVLEWHNFLQADLSNEMMRNLQINQEKWEEMVFQESLDEMPTEISDASGGSNTSVDNLLPKTDTHINIQERHNKARRYSVPIALHTEFISKTTRRDSYPMEPNSSIKEKTYDDKLSFKDSDFLFHSSLSLGLNNTRRDFNGGNFCASDILLPEHSIATMTNVEEANRISIVLHGNAPTKSLVRQQTYPPIQVFSRARYLSAAAEMGICIETLTEVSNHSSSSDISQLDDQRETKETILKTDANIENIVQGDYKPEKQPVEKENLNPSEHRRSSAPVALEDIIKIYAMAEFRRHSVPVMSHTEEISIIESENNNNEPTELDDQTRLQIQIQEINSSNDDSRVNDKTSNLSDRNNDNYETIEVSNSMLRRNSGGAEMINNEPNYKIEANGRVCRPQRTDFELSKYADSKRRASLPVEVLTKTGEY